MMKLRRSLLLLILLVAFVHLANDCRQATDSTPVANLNLLEAYVDSRDISLPWEIVSDRDLGAHRLMIVRFESQDWLSNKEVKSPRWWHWLTVVVPSELNHSTALLMIGGGNRQREQPTAAGQELVETALLTKSVVVELHNVPNQPIEFQGDTLGPRSEDAIIAYGWRKFLEGGAKDEDVKWLARLPMTTAAVRAMDVAQALAEQRLDTDIDSFVVAGGSKRGWTTWTTGAIDDRVRAIVPIVIDLLNVVPSFEHHWQAYGAWAPAINDYQREGIMEWQGSAEYDRLLELTEPFSFRNRLTLPKMIINATGDQFFLPDSWQFYWHDLLGEKQLRYVPNSEHSMRETDAWSTLLAFYGMVLSNQHRPEFDWRVEGNVISIQTKSAPSALKLWQADNPHDRDFRVDQIGRVYQSSNIDIRQDGRYRIELASPDQGFRASFVELTFPGFGDLPLKLSTGVVVRPDKYPFSPFASDNPRGERR